MRRLIYFLLAGAFIGTSQAYAADLYLFQGFDSPDRYVKLPSSLEKPVVMIYIPHACPKCWNEWRQFFPAFSKWEKKFDVWFIGDFPRWGQGRDFFRAGSYPAKVSNSAYHDPGRRFFKSLAISDKRPSLIVQNSGKFAIREDRREQDWSPALTEIMRARP